MKFKSKKMIEATEYLLSNPDLTKTAVAKLFGVDRHCIPVKNYFQYTIPFDEKLYCFEEEELKIVHYWEQHPEMSFAKLKNMFGKPSKFTTLKRWIEILGGSTERHYSITFNRNAFAKIEKEEDAYWLGFLLADGYVSEDRNLVRLKLGAKDRSHLVKFLRYLQFDNIEKNIKEDVGGAYARDNVCFYVEANSQTIVANLKQYGLFQAKSGKEIPYVCDTLELEKAYIRGIFDGDGYLRDGDQSGFGVVGSFDVLEYIKDYLQKNVCDMSKVSITSHGAIFRLATNGTDRSSQVLKHLYQNATIFLNRKQTLFLEKYNN